MPDGSFSHVAAGRTAGALAIVFVSASLGMLAGWRAPGIDRYARDWLMRARGPLPAPDDIAIVAIDEPSLTRFGRFPWARSLTARAIDAIAADQPKVIALDVLYTDPSGAEEDSKLVHSIARAGDVVIAAQLVDAPAAGGAAAWLLPIPDLQQAAAGVGHVNVTTESEGVARQVLLREADDAGRAIRSMAIEAVRVGEGVAAQAVTDAPGALLVGSRSVPVEASAPPVVIGATQGAPQIYRAARMEIDYIGPAGSFSPHTYSFADVVEGRCPPGRFRGKYVLLGATAASLGDRLSSPFVHQSDVRGGQHGSLMPGVEVLANALNTILRGRFYSETPDWLTFLCAALSAAFTLGILNLADGRYEALQQAGALAGIVGGLLATGYLAFTRLLIFPPLAPAFVSFASAGMLGLLQRLLATSSRLDASIADVSRSGEVLAPSTPPSGAAESVAHLSGAAAVAIFDAAGAGRYRFTGGFGAPLTPSLNSGRAVAIHSDRERPGRFFTFPKDRESQFELLKLPLPVSTGGPGLLVLAHVFDRPPSVETLRICATIAGSSSNPAVGHDEYRPRWRLMPRGLEWKARALGRLNGRIRRCTGSWIATGFQQAEGRIFLLPSFNGSGGSGQNTAAFGPGGSSPANYSLSPQFSLFTPVAKSGFVVGGSLTSSRSGNGALASSPDFDPGLLATGPGGANLQTSGSSIRTGGGGFHTGREALGDSRQLRFRSGEPERQWLFVQDNPGSGTSVGHHSGEYQFALGHLPDPFHRRFRAGSFQQSSTGSLLPIWSDRSK